MRRGWNCDSEQNNRRVSAGAGRFICPALLHCVYSTTNARLKGNPFVSLCWFLVVVVVVLAMNRARMPRAG